MQKIKFGISTKTILNTLALLLVFSSASALAAEVTLTWDPVDIPSIGYRLYQRTSLHQDFEEVWSGSNTLQTISGLEIGTAYYFVVRAFKGDRESKNSNQLKYTPTDTTSGSPSGGNDKAPVSLTPTLEVPGNRHGKTPETYTHSLFQISTAADFSALVFERTYNQYLTELTITDLILDPDTVYYWRVKYNGGGGAATDWSPGYTFTTIGYASSGDTDGNGLKDHQEVAEGADMDRNGTNDGMQSNMYTIKGADVQNRLISIKCEDPNTQIGSFSALSTDDLSLAPNQPEEISNVISFKLYLADDADWATVTIFFSEPAPAEAMWLKYDPVDGWDVYTPATFSADRRSVTLEIEDGGIWDQDGVKNGIIVDPAGLGIYSQTSASISSEGRSNANDSDGSGCFATSLFRRK